MRRLGEGPIGIPEDGDITPDTRLIAGAVCAAVVLGWTALRARFARVRAVEVRVIAAFTG